MAIIRITNGGQHLYPRYELMEPIVEVFRRTAKTVPVFSDKHFSYSLSKAKQMYAWSRELNYPVMAGSSIPLTKRSPRLEIPYDAQIENALTLGYGELDAYGFHTLEALQCMVERRKGGETGIRSVQWIEGDAVWQWRDGPGRWSIPLLEAALSRNPSLKPGRLEENVKQPVVFRARIFRRDAGRLIHAGRACQRVEFRGEIEEQRRTRIYVF